jgi:hypothetical protein
MRQATELGAFEKLSLWTTVITVVWAVVTLLLLLIPRVITHSIQCLAQVLRPVFLFSSIEIPRFQWPQLRLDVIFFEVQPPQVSLFKRPPPLSC